MSSKLERLTNVAIIIACVAVTGALAARFLGLRAGGGTGRAPAYKTGESVSAVRGVDYRQADKTLLIVVSSQCRYCTQSMPFYRRLVEEARTHGRRVQVVAAGAEDVTVVKTYLTDHDVAIERVVKLDPGTIKFGGTPTLLLIDSSGKVQALWEGLVPPAREPEVIKAIVG